MSCYKLNCRGHHQPELVLTRSARGLRPDLIPTDYSLPSLSNHPDPSQIAHRPPRLLSDLTSLAFLWGCRVMLDASGVGHPAIQSGSIYNYDTPHFLPLNMPPARVSTHRNLSRLLESLSAITYRIQVLALASQGYNIRLPPRYILERRMV